MSHQISYMLVAKESALIFYKISTDCVFLLLIRAGIPAIDRLLKFPIAHLFSSPFFGMIPHDDRVHGRLRRQADEDGQVTH